MNNLHNILLSNGRAVERAIIALYYNSKFNNEDIGQGSYYAGWLNAGKHLTGSDLIKARKLVLNHLMVLVEINYVCTDRHANMWEIG